MIVRFVFLGHGRASNEAIGFTLLMSMFFGWAGMPIAAMILRAANLPYRSF